MTILAIKDASLGFVPDAIPEEMLPGQWNIAQNMRFRDGAAEAVKGMQPIFDAPSAPPYFLLPYQTTTQRLWIHCTLTQVFADDGTTRTDITPYQILPTIASITHVGAVATLTTATVHGLTTGDEVEISGATEAIYNGTYTVTVTSPTAFTYTVTPIVLPAMSSLVRSGSAATATFVSPHGLITGATIVITGASGGWNGTYVVTNASPTTLTFTVGTPSTPAVTPGTATWTIPAANATVVGSGLIHKDLLFTGGVDDRWTGGVLNGVLVLNNPINGPFYWGGDVTERLQALPGWPSDFRAASMRPFSFYLIALDITKGVGTTPVRYPHMMKGSWAAAPGFVPAGWDPSDPSQNGIERDLAETTDYMVDCLPLGNTLIVYKQQNRYLVTENFGESVYNTQLLPGGGGLLAPGCCIDTPSGHIALGNGDVYIHQGGVPRSIVQAVIQRWLFRNIDQLNATRSFVVLNPKCREVWICFPQVGEEACTQAIIYNWTENRWGARDLQNVTYGANGQIPEMLLGGTYGDAIGTYGDQTRTYGETEFSPNELMLLVTRLAPDIDLVETGNSDAGIPLPHRLERRGMDAGDPTLVKCISLLRPRVQGISGETIRFQVGSALAPDSEPTWAEAQPFIIGTQTEVPKHSNGGQFLAVAIFNDPEESRQPFRYRSYDMDVITLGRY